MHVLLEKCYRWSQWAMKLVYLNLLWIGFTIAGLGVFGFIPATIAMFVVARKWMMGGRDISIWNTFWQAYRTGFLKNSLFGAAVLFVGYVLLVEMNIFWSQESSFYFAVSLAVIATFIIYLIIFIYFFPLYVHFQSTIPQYIKWALVMGIMYTFQTVGLLLLLAFLYVMFWAFPLLFILAGGSIPAFIIMWSAFRRFPEFTRTQLE